MSYERMIGAMDERVPESYEGWRCIHCGEVVDPVILYNRQKSASLKQAGTSRKAAADCVACRDD
jgi:hypothetical protein